MNLNKYQSEAMKFARFSSLDYPFSGLSEEVGEVQGKLAKAQRRIGVCQENVLARIKFDGSHLSEHDKRLKLDLKKELGDCLWMLAACAANINMTLEEIATANIEKLKDRDNRGVIVGDGDNR